MITDWRRIEFTRADTYYVKIYRYLRIKRQREEAMRQYARNIYLTLMSRGKYEIYVYEKDAKLQKHIMGYYG